MNVSKRITLAAAAVAAAFNACAIMGKAEENTRFSSFKDFDGNEFRIDLAKVDRYAEQIVDMLKQLPEKLYHNKGGVGWKEDFLKAADGKTWTGSWENVNQLFVLGQATGYIDVLSAEQILTLRLPQPAAGPARIYATILDNKFPI